MPWIKSTFNDTCTECEIDICIGDELFYENYRAYCKECGEEIEPKQKIGIKLP